ncbi:MAG: Asp/Glu/hydantoin racemase [bacterium]|nr:Asp/Glu/hydantoin racemase [bacterium]
MKILIINPNSDPVMTETIRKAAETYAAGDFEVDCKLTPGAPKFIETYEDDIQCSQGMLQIVRENEDKVDAFIVACHDDPNLDAIKEVSAKPVVGIGEASMKIATMLGHKFSVISTDIHSVPGKEVLVRKYHLQDKLASVKAPAESITDLNDVQSFLKTARAAIEEDMAEVLVLGCAGLAGMDKKLEKELGVPVLDGVVCALIIAAGLVKYGVSTSKIRLYNPEY